MFTLDTNTIIYYAAGDEKVVAFFSKHKNDIFYLPSIVIAEFLSYPLIDAYSATIFRLFIQQMTIVNLDLQIAELSAKVRKNHNCKLADSVIAATALLTQSTLITRNIADFKKISNLKIFKI